MAITKDHAYVTALGTLGVGLAVALLRSGPGYPASVTLAAAPNVAIAAPSSSPPPPPSKCAEACAKIADWCVAGRAINCVDLLTRYEREGTVTCDDGISAAELAAINWCPDGGEQKPLVVKQ